LVLTVSPLARRGDKITATIQGSNVLETVVEISAPDTVVISQPHRLVAGIGTFSNRIDWSVEHVQPATVTLVEVTASAGPLVQTGLCRIMG
jgi:hypothetical protein